MVAALAVGLFAAGEALAAEDQLRFVTCPVYRDTDAGRKSGCWLADRPETGQRYDVSLAPTKPDWNRAILVEGVGSHRQDNACGGIVLDPVRVSVLDLPCTRAMLPAESYPGRAYRVPPRNVRPLGEPRAPRTHEAGARTFHLLFDHGSDFVVYQYDDYMLDQAIAYIRALPDPQVVVTGHAVTERARVSGVVLAEEAGLARRRAQRIGLALRRLGLPASRLVVRWVRSAGPIDAELADGLIEPSRRRVDILVSYGGTSKGMGPP